MNIRKVIILSLAGCAIGAELYILVETVQKTTAADFAKTRKFDAQNKTLSLDLKDAQTRMLGLRTEKVTPWVKQEPPEKINVEADSQGLNATNGATTTIVKREPPKEQKCETGESCQYAPMWDGTEDKAPLARQQP